MTNNKTKKDNMLNNAIRMILVFAALFTLSCRNNSNENNMNPVHNQSPSQHNQGHVQSEEHLNLENVHPSMKESMETWVPIDKEYPLGNYLSCYYAEPYRIMPNNDTIKLRIEWTPQKNKRCLTVIFYGVENYKIHKMMSFWSKKETGKGNDFAMVRLDRAEIDTLDAGVVRWIFRKEDFFQMFTRYRFLGFYYETPGIGGYSELITMDLGLLQDLANPFDLGKSPHIQVDDNVS